MATLHRFSVSRFERGTGAPYFQRPPRRAIRSTLRIVGRGRHDGYQKWRERQKWLRLFEQLSPIYKWTPVELALSGFRLEGKSRI